MNEASAVFDKNLVEEARRMSFAEKWRRIGELGVMARELHKARFRRINPGATPREEFEDWVLLTSGPEVVEILRKVGRL